MKDVLGPSHHIVLDVSKKIKMLCVRFGIENGDMSEILQKVNIASSNGDIETVELLLKDRVDANDKDNDGMFPLHYAIYNGHIDVVNMLLKNGANVTQVINLSNTTYLHTATYKGFPEIVETLLQYVSRNKRFDFINAKTIDSGDTSLHIAAKNGYFNIAKYLLVLGAAYNIENNESKMPLNLSKNLNITALLQLVETLFKDAKDSSGDIINKLNAVQPDEFPTVCNVCNNQRKTLYKVAKINKHKNLKKLKKMLKFQHKTYKMLQKS